MSDNDQLPMIDAGKFIDYVWSMRQERDQLRAEVEALQRDAGRYQWLCEHFGATKLPCAVERILAGDIYVADGKAGVDVAIDAAMAKEGSSNEL